MRAIVQERYGDPADVLELREVEMPAVGEEDVRVRVHAASLHPDVWHVVTGRPYVVRLVPGIGPGLLKPRRPIPGTDMAGVVESVGAGVRRFRPGDAVFGETVVTDSWINGGAFAEYVSVHRGLLAPKPDDVSFEQAASVPTSGYITLTNLRGLDRLRPGEKVLVNGAGGGVGTIALQLAKARDAHVTAVDSTAKLDMLRSLGADRVMDYTREDFTRGETRYDLIFDIPGNHPFSACRRVLEPDGRYVLIAHDRYGAVGKRVLGSLPRFFRLVLLSRFVDELGGPDLPRPTRKEAMAVLREHLEDGTLAPVIDSTYPLGEFREAFRHMIEDETLGKVILTTVEAG